MPTYTKSTKIIFLDLPSNIAEKVDTLRKKYNPAAVKRWNAHITFKQDEDFLIENEKLVNLVSNFVNNMPAFKLELDGIDMHYHEDNYNIFVSIKKNEKLLESIKNLSKQLETFIDPNSSGALSSTKWEQSDEFFPHITIAVGKGKEQGQKLFEEIQSQKVNLKESIVCKSITIAEWNAESWKEIIKLN
jgi:2'-5' RNA ligase